MPITFITGTPGVGKTLRAVEKIVEAVKKGRPVWSNIDGINVKGCGVLGTDWDGNWQTFDDGTLFVIDEAQKIWRATSKSGLSDNANVIALEEHRHRGMDFILMTPHHTFLHSHVRKMIDEHEHLKRSKGSKQVGITTQNKYFNPDDAGECAIGEKKIWKHPTHLYDCYKSASIHTMPPGLPKRLKYLAAALLVGGVFVAWRLSNSPLFSDETRGAVAGPVVPAPVVAFNEQDWADIPTRVPVSGCISSESNCRCYSITGQPLDLSAASCFTRTLEPLPILIRTSTGGGERQSAPLLK
jgi:zona occludens toxin